MKQASILLHLDKSGHSVPRHEVTPIEAILLVAEHHKNAGGNPVEVIKDTVKDCPLVVTRVKKMVKTGEKKEGDKTIDITEERETEEKRGRTADEELNRLRSRYAAAKVDALSTRVREFPDDFEKAVQLGLQLSLPTKSLSETKLI